MCKSCGIFFKTAFVYNLNRKWACCLSNTVFQSVFSQVGCQVGEVDVCGGWGVSSILSLPIQFRVCCCKGYRYIIVCGHVL